jgi:hypothetical protein
MRPSVWAEDLLNVIGLHTFVDQPRGGVVARVHETDVLDLRGFPDFIPVANFLHPFAYLVGEHEFEFGLYRR